MSKEEIALQITLKVIEGCSYSSIEQIKTLPYEIYNSIYENLNFGNLTADDFPIV